MGLSKNNGYTLLMYAAIIEDLKAMKSLLNMGPTLTSLSLRASLRIKLYENLSSKNKLSINYNNNYGKNRYKEDLEIVKEK